MTYIVPYNFSVDRDMRSRKFGHRAKVVWFTGLSGSGKSTIANQVEKELFKLGIHTYSLDGDNIRTGLNKDLEFNREDRMENLRRIAEVARLFMDSGTVLLAAFITPLICDRELVRQIIGRENLIEIFINTSLEECERRDVKGLYRKARAGEIQNFTGITDPFEKPEHPDLVIETENETIQAAVDRIITFLRPQLRINDHE